MHLMESYAIILYTLIHSAVTHNRGQSHPVNSKHAEV